MEKSFRQSDSDWVHNSYTAWGVLLCGIILTIVAWWASDKLVDRVSELRFNTRANEISSAIRQRMDVYEDVLWGGVSFLNVIGDVNRNQWQQYVARLDVDTRWPGIQGLGYSIPVSPEDKQSHINAIRAEGFPDYLIRPEGVREEYSAIIFLEPFDWRNQRAFGYDMWSNDMRRAAMTRARDTGLASISGIITLVQETDDDVQRGFLTYVPLYESDMPVSSVEERRAAFRGWVYAPFRMADLMEGILGDNPGAIGFEVFDGDTTSDNLMFNSRETTEMSAVSADNVHMATTQISLQGRNWTVRFLADQSALDVAAARLPLLIGVVGVIVNIFLFYVVASQASLQRRARGIARDMTARIRSSNEKLESSTKQLQERERQLQASEAKLRSVIETVPDGIITTDQAGNILGFNPSAETIFGYAAEEVIGKNVEMLMPKKYAIAHTSHMEKFANGSGAGVIGKRRVMTGLHKTGATFEIDLIINQGSEDTITGVVRNIADQVAAERELDQTVLRLEKSNAELGHFAYVASHDLQEPLRKVQAFSDRLRTKYESALDEEGLDYLARMHQATKRMQKLINDLLEYSRIGTKGEEFATIDLDVLVREVVNDLEFQIIEANAEVEVKKLPVVTAAPLQMRQLFQNLIGNALKYRREDVSCRVCISSAIVDQNDMSQGSGSTRFYNISIVDNGIGFDQKYVTRIFGIFQRLHGRSKYEGTGIGLAICQKIVEQHGGLIFASSASGEGSSFTVSLPIETESEKQEKIDAE